MERPTFTKISPEIRTYIEHLESELYLFKNRPYTKTYITIYRQIESFNDQLTIKRVMIDGEDDLSVIPLILNVSTTECIIYSSLFNRCPNVLIFSISILSEFNI